MNPMNILLVEDDPRVASALRKGLVENEIAVSVARTARDAVRQSAECVYDMVLLDLGLPDADGREVMRRIRENYSRVPVIVITARDQVDDRVSALDAGADDYLVKPFAFSELLARVRSVHRRSQARAGGEMRVGDLEIDPMTRRVAREGRDIDLTPREFDLLLYLARHAGETVSREMIARDVWQVAGRMTPFDNVLDVHMAHLREKVDKPFAARLLRTVRGVGFRIEAPP